MTECAPGDREVESRICENPPLLLKQAENIVAKGKNH